MFTLRLEVQKSCALFSGPAWFGNMQWDFEEICVYKSEKWAKLVETCSPIFLSNLLHVRLASNMGKKGFDHRSFLEPNMFGTEQFGKDAPTNFPNITLFANSKNFE